MDVPECPLLTVQDFSLRLVLLSVNSVDISHMLLMNRTPLRIFRQMSHKQIKQTEPEAREGLNPSDLFDMHRAVSPLVVLYN